MLMKSTPGRSFVGEIECHLLHNTLCTLGQSVGELIPAERSNEKGWTIPSFRSCLDSKLECDKKIPFHSSNILSISPTFYEIAFCTKVFLHSFSTYSLYLYMTFFVRKEIDGKTARKMLVKLTKGREMKTGTVGSVKGGTFNVPENGFCIEEFP
jgi:hypothetical protein